MGEIIVKMTSDHIKAKGGEYVQDIVRCKDCKYRRENIPCCIKHNKPVNEWWFCADGEVKDDV